MKKIAEKIITLFFFLLITTLYGAIGYGLFEVLKFLLDIKPKSFISVIFALMWMFGLFFVFTLTTIAGINSRKEEKYYIKNKTLSLDSEKGETKKSAA